MARVFEWVDAWVFAALRGADDECTRAVWSRCAMHASPRPLASALHEQMAGRRGGAFSIVDDALGVLNSRRTRLPVVKTTADVAFVSDPFMKRADERYVKSVSA